MILKLNPSNVLLRKAPSISSKKTNYFTKAQIIQQIASFILSQGWSVAETSQSFNFKIGNESFSDLLAIISGKYVEIIVGVHRLSKSQSRYKRSIENAGGCYAIVADQYSFLNWYYSTFKF